MAYEVRRTPPQYLRYFLNILQCLKEVTSKTTKQQQSPSSDMERPDAIAMDLLIKILIKETNCEDSATAHEIVADAIDDGMLVSRNNNKFVRLPAISEIPNAPQRDLYCFECHLPGLLEHCDQCNRSFHSMCYRKNPERPIYHLPSSKKQKNRLPAFSPDSQTDTDDDNVTTEYSRGTNGVNESASFSTVQNVIHRDFSVAAGTNEAMASSRDPSIMNVIDHQWANATESKPSLADLCMKESKLDVICLGEIRSPNRKRRRRLTEGISNSQFYKNEQLPNDDENELILCTCCRLLKSADIRNPPHMKSDELCYLLNFIFLRNRSWVIDDISSYLSNWKISPEAIPLITRTLLFKNIVRFDEVYKKIQEHKYSLLMEFLIDLLDMQHQIGVFFGPDSMELEATKWLLRYVTHDLSEIRRCADCFRYSHEKNSLMWFAKPCVQRHELVYAKHGRFPYWPAKVVRVLRDNKYDVRFFGGNHSRALINASNIRPIESEMPKLQFHKYPGLRKAFTELHYHKLLSAYPSEKFSFHADPQEIEFIISTVRNISLPFDLIPNSSEHNKRNKSSLNESALSDPMSVTDTSSNISNGRIRIIENSDNDYDNDNDNNNNINQQKKNQNNSIRKAKNEVSNVKVVLKRLDSHHPLKQQDSNSKGSERNNLSNELENLQNMVKFVKMENSLLKKENQKLKKENKHLELEKEKIKRKIWCIVCLKEAIYICCLKASYCSKKCKKFHWNKGHNTLCKNKGNKLQLITE